MQIINPTFLWLTLLAIIPIALYLFRRKSKTINVSTLVFFKSLAREHQESAWLRRLKKFVSFMLTMIVLLAAIAALSRLIFSPKGDDVQTVVILLDRSASMAAEGEGGIARLNEAKARVKERLAGLSEDIGVALVAYDARPEVVVPRTIKRRELLSRLDEIKVRPVADDLAVAIESAEILAGLETPAVIWHVTDEVEEITATEEKVRTELISVALPTASNVGITAFRVRPAPLEHSQYEIYVQVSLNQDAPTPVEARLEVYVGGVPAQFPTIDLEPGMREGRILKVGGVERQQVRLKLVAENDALSWDNEVLVPLPEVRPVSVALISPEGGRDAFLELALAALHDGETIIVGAGTPEQFPSLKEVDVVIFDRVFPESWPENIPAIVVNPPGNLGPIRSRLLENPIPHESLRVTDDSHPLLFRVSSGRVSVAQTNVFDLTGSLQPIWMAGSEPVLAAGEVKGQRIVMMGFSPSQSEQLPLTASFPLLMGNAILWCAETSQTMNDRILESSAGEVVAVEGQTVKWTTWQNSRQNSTSQKLDSAFLELDRIGIWETDTGQQGTSYLLSWGETDIPSLPTAENGEPGIASEKRSAHWLTGDITWLLLSLIVVALLLESYLFHRHAVY